MRPARSRSRWTTPGTSAGTGSVGTGPTTGAPGSTMARTVQPWWSVVLVTGPSSWGGGPDRVSGSWGLGCGSVLLRAPLALEDGEVDLRGPLALEPLVLDQHGLLAHAELAQHGRRGTVPEIGAGGHPPHAQPVERHGEHGAGGLGGVPVPGVVGVDHVADLAGLVLVAVPDEHDVADQHAVLAPGDREAGGTARFRDRRGV